VSFIRAYSKHECAHIFRIRELDLVKLALGFGLLHMPKMPELRQRNLADVKPFVMMDMSKIPYK
jgi:ATP-dependent RNA helicase DDX55/SPB4